MAPRTSVRTLGALPGSRRGLQRLPSPLGPGSSVRPRFAVDVVRDLVYASGSSDPAHRLDVYYPRGRCDRMPVVLYVHGGAFAHLSKETHGPLARAFARRGFLVFNISYRLAPRHRFPAAVEDVAAAFLYVAARAGHWGGDPGRLVLAGESAGANLVTALTLASTYERGEPFARAVFETGITPAAVVPACGIFQVTDTARFVRRKPHLSRLSRWGLWRTERRYLGRDSGTLGPLADFADPLLWLERGERPDRPLPPFFLPVGTKDPLLDDTRRLAAALSHLGAIGDARYYEGEIHAFHALPYRDAARRCWRDKFGFLEEHLGLTA